MHTNHHTYNQVQDILLSHEKQIARRRDGGYPIGFICELELVTPQPAVEILDAMPFQVVSDAMDRMEL
jgi:hypothetical protein